MFGCWTLRLALRYSSFIFLAWSLSALPAFAFPAQDDTTPGTMALAYKGNRDFTVRQDLGVVDAKVVTYPPDSAKLDRRLESLSIVGFNLPINSRFGVRAQAAYEYSHRREAETEEPISLVDRTVMKIAAQADGVFITTGGLELSGGMTGWLLPTSTETVDSDLTSSQTDFSSVLILAPRFALVKRGPSWSGGFYYQMGKEGERTFDKSASDGSTVSGTTVAYIPPTIGLIGDTSIRGGSHIQLEGMAIQAGSGGEKGNDGRTINSNYMRLKAQWYSLYNNGMAWRGGISYQTLSYADNAYVSIENIPFTTIRGTMLTGTDDSHIDAGFVFGYGFDKQSTSGFNAKYELKGLALTLGLGSKF